MLTVPKSRRIVSFGFLIAQTLADIPIPAGPTKYLFPFSHTPGTVKLWESLRQSRRVSHWTKQWLSRQRTVNATGATSRLPQKAASRARFVFCYIAFIGIVVLSFGDRLYSYQ